MAIDFGTKRTGIAVTDPLKIIASPLTTVDTKKAIDFLKEYFEKEEVECIVVGNPNQRGRKRDVGEFADDFCERIKRIFPAVKTERIDEFYTSKLAYRAILQSGIRKKKRRNKSLVDKVSAAIMLQNYLDKEGIRYKV